MVNTLIYGVVIDASTQMLITTAMVSCPQQTVNNGQGSYSCSAMTSGVFTFTASAPGYNDQAIPVTCGGGIINQNFSLDPS